MDQNSAESGGIRLKTVRKINMSRSPIDNVLKIIKVCNLVVA